MTPKLKRAYQSEMTQMRNAYNAQDLKLSFHHLERAHILGQRNFKAHLKTHWWMLKIGVLRRDIRESVGQVLRLLAVFPASVFGWVPVGNTGGANVSALKSMSIPADLMEFFET